MRQVVPRVARRAPRVLAGVRPWAVALALAPSGALMIAICPLLAEAAGQTTSGRGAAAPRDGVAGRRHADPVATATSGTDDTLDLGEKAGGPRTTGLIGWPDFAMNCYFVPRGPDHKGRRVLCVDTWDGPSRLGGLIRR